MAKNAKPTKTGTVSRLDALPAETLKRLRETAGISVWTWHVAEDELFTTSPALAATGSGHGASLAETLQGVHADDRAAIRRKVRQAVATGHSGTLKFRGAPELGELRYFNATYFPISTGGRIEQIQIIVRDVTRAMLAETALRESEDHYRHAVDLNPEIPWLADAEGLIIEVGPRWLTLVGMSEAETLGHGWVSALHPDDVPETLRQWEKSLASGVPVDVEYRVRLAGGRRYRWMRARAAARRDADGAVLRWYGTLEDVHDRKRAEAALRESEGFARSVVEASTTAIEVLDRKGRLIFMNGPGMRLMEVDDFAAIKGRRFDTFWPEDSHQQILEAIKQAQAGEITRQSLFGPTAKGAPRWWDLSISPIRSADGSVTRLLALSRDVTEDKRNEEEVVAGAKRLANVLESTMDSVISVDQRWRVTYMNRRAMATLPDTVAPVGRDIRELFSAATASTFFDRLATAMEDRSNSAFEEFLPHVGRWFEVQASGTASGLIIFFRDVTERRRAQEELAHLARHDALTGLPNRVQFQERLEAALRPEGMVAVLCIDLDDFKLVNDTLGHPAGDQLLREVARRLKVSAGAQGMVARLGGDEFALLLPVLKPEHAAAMAQRMLEGLARPFDIEGEQVAIGASIGIALAPQDGTDAERLLQTTDVALYRVKAANGRSYRFFEPAMDHELRDRREMKRDLSVALGRGELGLVYQPQIELKGNRLVGFEALLRWNHPTRGAISPVVFIPLAEETGIIDEIGRFVLREACAEAARWPEDVSVAVNLSAAQFRTKAVQKAVAAALSSSGLAPGRLELEITESVLLDESSDAITALEELHAGGIRVALDDFGTGYASLSYLRRFPFDKIKIDRSFVADLPEAEGSVAIVRAIIGLGRSLKTRVTAEGVESWEQLLLLSAEGCDEAQGYLFSQPLPAAQARALAEARSTKARIAQPDDARRQA